MSEFDKKAGLDWWPVAEPIPGATDRQNVAGGFWIVPEPLPQCGKMGLDRSALRTRRVPPDLGQQLGPRHDAAAMSHERREQVELLRPERDRRETATHRSS